MRGRICILACWGLLVLLLAGCNTAPVEPLGSPTAPAAEVTPPQPDEMEPIPPPVERQQDPALWEEISYVAQRGQAGQRWKGSGEVETEPVATIVMDGTRTTLQVQQDARQVAEQYVLAYQAGQWEEVAGLLHTGAISRAANEFAGMQIAGFELGEPDLTVTPAGELGQHEGVGQAVPDQDFELDGNPYVELFGIEASIPGTVQFSVWDTSLTWEGTLRAVWEPEMGWKMMPWAILAAGVSGETWEGVMLKGVAVFPHETLAVVGQSPQPPVYVTVRERLEGSQNAPVLTDTDPVSASGWAWMPPVDPLLRSLTVELAIGFGANRSEHVIPLPLVQ